MAMTKMVIYDIPAYHSKWCGPYFLYLLPLVIWMGGLDVSLRTFTNISHHHHQLNGEGQVVRFSIVVDEYAM